MSHESWSTTYRKMKNKCCVTLCNDENKQENCQNQKRLSCTHARQYYKIKKLYIFCAKPCQTICHPCILSLLSSLNLLCYFSINSPLPPPMCGTESGRSGSGRRARPSCVILSSVISLRPDVCEGVRRGGEVLACILNPKPSTVSSLILMPCPKKKWWWW